MSNGDKNYKHMVVSVGNVTALMFTAKGEPAVFNDTGPAELLCAQLRERQPLGNFQVLSFQVL